jgi:hypothetical protein
MRFVLPLLATLLVASTASAEPPTSESGARTTGAGFASTGVVLTGFGAYFAYKGTQDGDLENGNLGIALLAGGLITTGVGVTMYLTGSSTPAKPEKPKQAIVIGPASASYVATF